MAASRRGATCRARSDPHNCAVIRIFPSSLCSALFCSCSERKHGLIVALMQSMCAQEVATGRRVEGPQPTMQQQEGRLPAAAVAVIAIASAALLAVALAVVLRLHSPRVRCCVCCKRSSRGDSTCKPEHVHQIAAEPAHQQHPPDVVVRITAKRNGKSAQTIVPRSTAAATAAESTEAMQRRRQQQQQAYEKVRSVRLRACRH